MTLPGQPDAGLAVIVPLGGDGYRDPQSMYAINMNVDMDASGSTCRCVINGDDRFLQIATILGYSNSDTTPTPHNLEIKTAEGVTFVFQDLPIIGGNGASQDATFSAPPLFSSGVRGQWTVRCDNVDTFNLQFKAIIMNFRIDAAHKVPLGVLNQGLRNQASWT